MYSARFLRIGFLMGLKAVQKSTLRKRVVYQLIFWISLLFFPFFSFAQEVKICLVMVVENQEKTLLSSLESVESIVDAVCIIDGGSLDETIVVAKKWIQDRDFPGVVLTYDSKRSATAETFAIESAETLLDVVEFPLETTYFLFLDGAKVVKIDPEFNKNQLHEDAYLVLEKTPLLGCSIYALHLMKASLSWKCSDPISLNWKSTHPICPIKLRHVSLEDWSLSLDREINKLEAALEKSPENGFYLVSLAQRYKGAKKYEQAIDLYLKRIAIGGDVEEIWFSTFMIGACYNELDCWEKALHWYMEAFQLKPNYPDPIHQVATHYRLKGENDLAYLFAKYGSIVTRSLDQNYFSYPPLSDYQFDEELSIAAYYTRFREEGFLSAGRLMLRRNIPSWVQNQNGCNIFYYPVLLKNTKFHLIDFNMPPIKEGKEERYHPISASILKTEIGYQLLCTAVNYTQIDRKVLSTIDSDGVFRSRNFFCCLDKEYHLLSKQEVIETLPREKYRSCNVEGIQDCRLFEWNGSNWFTCTTNDTNPTGNPQVSLCQLSDDFFSPVLTIEQLIPLYIKNPRECEKNWLPIVESDQLRMIYSYDPFVILTPDLVTGQSEPSQIDLYGLDLSRLKGAASPIPFDDGYLMLVYETIFCRDYSRAHLHRFLFLDCQFRVQKISNPFVFSCQGTEYCRGMTIDHSESQLILPVGIEYNELYLCIVSLEDVRKSLFELERVYSASS